MTKQEMQEQVKQLQEQLQNRSTQLVNSDHVCGQLIGSIRTLQQIIESEDASPQEAAPQEATEPVQE